MCESCLPSSVPHMCSRSLARQRGAQEQSRRMYAHHSTKAWQRISQEHTHAATLHVPPTTLAQVQQAQQAPLFWKVVLSTGVPAQGMERGASKRPPSGHGTPLQMHPVSSMQVCGLVGGYIVILYLYRVCRCVGVGCSRCETAGPFGGT